jgi:Fe-S-cluster containining protein
MIYENVVFPDSVRFECRLCGFCCRDEPPDVNFKEQQKIEARGFANFLEASNETGDKNIRRKKDGSCFFFTKENTCTIEDVKPSICRLEPFIIADYDDKTNMIVLELNPLAVTTCKGIFTGEIKTPEEIGKAAQSIIKEIQEITAKKTGLPITDKKVAAIIRKLIKDLNSN